MSLARFPFKTIRGYGHYHIAYKKTDAEWSIARLNPHRTRLDFTD